MTPPRNYRWSWRESKAGRPGTWCWASTLFRGNDWRVAGAIAAAFEPIHRSWRNHLKRQIGPSANDECTSGYDRRSSRNDSISSLGSFLGCVVGSEMGSSGACSYFSACRSRVDLKTGLAFSFSDLALNRYFRSIQYRQSRVDGWVKDKLTPLSFCSSLFLRHLVQFTIPFHLLDFSFPIHR